MRKSNLLTILSIVFLIFNNNIKAQENYQPGYVISLSGDTIKGFIDYKKWNKNPNEVSFKSNLNSEPLRYSPIEIKSFYVKDEMSFYIQDEKYIGAIVDVDKAPFKTSDLTYENGSQFEKDTVFLSIYVQGELSLYFLRDQNLKVHYFIENSEKEIKELIYLRYLNDIYINKSEKKTVVSQSEHYKMALKYYMRDDPYIQKKIDKTSYNGKQLIEIFKKYNQNKGANTIVYFKPSSKHIKLSPVVIGGIYYNSYNIKKNDYTYEGSFTTTSNMNPTNLSYTFGLGLNSYSPRRLQRFSWNQEFLFYSENVDFKYTDNRVGTLSFDYVYDLDLYYGKYNLMINYHQKYKNIKPYVNVGLSTAILLYHTGEKSITKNFSGTSDVSFENPDFVTVGLIAGVGASYKRISLEFRFEKGGSAGLPSSNKNIYFLLGYNFKSIEN